MRVTSKGQVTIPQNIRETLGIAPQTEIQFVEDNGKFFIVKAGGPGTKGKFSKFRGIATAKMSTNEILALTRDAE
jgi:antitoxin PrlF